VKKIVLAGGGTAGHIEPALAVARELQSRYPQASMIFLGTESGLETRLVPDAGFTLSLITKVKIARSFSPSLVLIPFLLIRSIVQSVRLLRSADALIGFGGYVSGPAYLAAALTHTPIVIHEANARPGIANRMGAHLTPYIAASHSVGQGIFSDALISGLPLREDVVSAFRVASTDWTLARLEAKRSLGFSDSKPLIFIFGGSQGSAAINAVFTSAQPSLQSAGIQILHGVGTGNSLPESTEAYHAQNYIIDMATAYLAADIVISRSGAVTCAEVNTLGKFALFIPLPIGNGEQELNGLNLVAQGRAEILQQKKFTSEWLIANIDRLLATSAAAPLQGSPIDIEAASKIVALIELAVKAGR
jgi:UDP-N-acetylglucosamine--N-acetylmuramyl-(pentapeptide) pyrophosphoryl-undecaprenol N-acetylglucosamine transferase